MAKPGHPRGGLLAGRAGWTITTGAALKVIGQLRGGRQEGELGTWPSTGSRVSSTATSSMRGGFAAGCFTISTGLGGLALPLTTSGGNGVDGGITQARAPAPGGASRRGTTAPGCLASSSFAATPGVGLALALAGVSFSATSRSHCLP